MLFTETLKKTRGCGLIYRLIISILTRIVLMRVCHRRKPILDNDIDDTIRENNPVLRVIRSSPAQTVLKHTL